MSLRVVCVLLGYWQNLASICLFIYICLYVFIFCFIFDILTIIHFWKLKAHIKKGQRKLCSVVSRLWILLKRSALGVVTSLGW